MAQAPPDGTIKILLVDDHAIVREGLRLLLGGQPDMTVVAEAGNGADAVAAAEREQPDIILLDVALAGEDGLELLPKLVSVAPGARVLVLTSATDQETHARAMRLGTMGVVSKDKVGAVLIKAVEKVYEGEVWFDRATMGSVLSVLSRGGNIDPEVEKIALLTEREREVITHLCEGLKNRQIGERLFISEITVRHHLTSIFGKLGVVDRLDLLLYAFRNGLADPPSKDRTFAANWSLSLSSNTPRVPFMAGAR